MQILGIDIGGSGIKGAPVDIKKGTFTAERQRIATPQPSYPEDVADVVAEIAKLFDWDGPIGCTFPAVIKTASPTVRPTWKNRGSARTAKRCSRPKHAARLR